MKSRKILVVLLSFAFLLSGCGGHPRWTTAQDDDRTVLDDGRPEVRDEVRSTYPAGVPGRYLSSELESSATEPEIEGTLTDDYDDYTEQNRQSLAQQRKSFVSSLEERVDQMRENENLTTAEQRWLDSVDARIEMLAQMSEQLTGELHEMNQTIGQETQQGRDMVQR